MTPEQAAAMQQQQQNLIVAPGAGVPAQNLTPPATPPYSHPQGMTPNFVTNPSTPTAPTIPSPPIPQQQTAPVAPVVPPAVKPMPMYNNPGGFTPTPEQLQQHQVQQQNALTQPPSSSSSSPQPQVNPAPQQNPGIPQQNQAPTIDTSAYPGIDPALINELAQSAQQDNVPQNQVDNYIQEQLEFLSRFESREHAEAYSEAYNMTINGLIEATGSQKAAAEKMEMARNAILQHGGEALLERFSTDPGMLTPEVLGPYLGQGEQNPWENYTGGYRPAPNAQQQQNPATPTAPQGGQLMGGAGVPQAPRNPAEISYEISQMYNPKNGIDPDSPQWQQKIIALHNERRQAMGGARP